MRRRTKAPRWTLAQVLRFAEGVEHGLGATQISLARVGQRVEELSERVQALEAAKRRRRTRR